RNTNDSAGSARCSKFMNTDVSSRSTLYGRWGAAIVLLLFLIAISPAFGVTWDERALQAYGEQIWDYYAGHRALADIDVGFGYTRIYGGLVEFLSSAAQHVIPANVYVVR